MIIQIDGKFHSELHCDCFPILAVIVPGKLINLLTKVPDPDNQIIVTETDGKKHISYGKNVDLDKLNQP